MKDQEKWDKRFLALAKHIASWSKDPSTQAASVIADADYRVVSVGYNGFAKGVHDLPERLNDRETKYKLMVHCERNALLFAKQPLDNCTIYTWPFMSCSVCAAMIIQSGITRHVAPYSENPRWIEQFELAKAQFAEAGVTLSLRHDEVFE